ncbi:TIP41-domain-containing protein [Hypoxylon sp. FL1284]|nr:TIP41-domain-containing protein [Hypoxylon sp. FL1284]
MSAPITTTSESFPGPGDVARATRTHRQGRFAVTTRKLPISKAKPIEALERDLGIPVPEMIFGDNAVGVRHGPSGWALEFCARDALDAVDKTGSRGMLRVAYARSWSASRERQPGVRDVVRPFDWSYTTDYRGSLVSAPPAPPPLLPSSADSTTPSNPTTTAETPLDTGDKEAQKEEGAEAQETKKASLDFSLTDEPIPIELLKRRDPILFFDEVTLYESELDDNGVSAYSVKVRVHERRMLLLARLFMRLDDVVVRVRDTRVYVDFASDRVTREYTARELGFDDLKKVSVPPPHISRSLFATPWTRGKDFANMTCAV